MLERVQREGNLWAVTDCRVFVVDGGSVQSTLWATLAFAVVGPSASCEGERSYNIQSAEVTPSVAKDNEKYPLEPLVVLFMLYFFTL